MYRREKFMASVPSKEYDEPPWIDPLDPRVQKLLKGQIAGYIVYSGQAITTISYNAYRTTTLYWLILMVNGYLFAEDIPYGTKLKILDISSLAKEIRPGQPAKSRRGTVVRA